MTALNLEDSDVKEEDGLNLGWYAEMPEGTLAAYDEVLDTTLRVVDRMRVIQAVR